MSLRALPHSPPNLLSVYRKSLLGRAYSSLPKYSPNHAWITVSNGVATVGISDHVQKKLGDAKYVGFLKPSLNSWSKAVSFTSKDPSTIVGSTVKKGGRIAVVEASKTICIVKAPVSGEIVEANEALLVEPALINSSPYDKAWICKIKLRNQSKLEGLMDETAYKKFIAKGQ